MQASSATNKLSRKALPMLWRFAARDSRAFTLIELLAIVAVISIVALTLLAALAKSNPSSKTFQCLNNHRRLAAAWRMYSNDFTDILLSSSSSMPGRSNWCTGTLDFNAANASNWDTNANIVKSPLWPYLSSDPSTFKCPADLSAVIGSTIRLPRVRSYSCSDVFGAGSWLDGSFNSSQTVWRTYAKGAEIMLPEHTFIFIDEHPDSINDGDFVNACTGAQPQDPPSASRIIDCPASWHNGGVVLSFVDGRAEGHKWIGKTIKIPMNYNGNFFGNVVAVDSYLDMHWLAANTTVRR